jgi:serine protease Do
MRGVDLTLFDFDYDLTWAGFFLSPDEKVYDRYGGRDGDSADDRLSLAGLRYAADRALAAHRHAAADQSVRAAGPRETVDRYPAVKRLKETACIHCHQVYDFRREVAETAGKWRLDDVWVYPLPENVGLTLEVDLGDRLRSVAADSPAGRAGLHAGDTLTEVNGVPVASQADVQYGLHRAPPSGQVTVGWRRDGREMSGRIVLPEGWRKTDISWRASTRSLGPSPCVQGEDLTAEEKRALGLSEKGLAFRQENFVHPAARRAGVRQNDIVIGIDGNSPEMTARQFTAHVRLNYRAGDVVSLKILRDGHRQEVPLKLPGRSPF